MKSPSKSAMLNFQQSIADTLRLPLPERDCVGGVEWEFGTRYGMVNVSTWGDDDEMIFIRFVSPAETSGWREAFKSAIPGHAVNPFSGKWNILAPDPAEAVAELARRLELMGYDKPATVAP